jgi:cell shape-determining protein MreC
MTDVAELKTINLDRLRRQVMSNQEADGVARKIEAAAERIEELEAENERLRAALEHLVDLDFHRKATAIAVCALDGTP